MTTSFRVKKFPSCGLLKIAFSRGGQDKDDAKREEIFWNINLAPDQIDLLLSPKVLTNIERVGSKGTISKDKIDRTDNLLIKGNNLISLHSLLPIYKGKVKCIYIDPPYNPDSKNNTFTYNNNFNRSTWLTFMKNRLEVAKKYLKSDGSLICAIDENEQAYLGVLLDEVFPNHERHCITIVHNPRGIQGTNFSYTHEYAFFIIPKGIKAVADSKIEDENIDFSNLRNWGAESERSDAKNCFYAIKVVDDQIVGFGDVLPDSEHPGQSEPHGNETWVYPIDIQGVERKWRYSRQSVEAILPFLRVKRKKERIEIEIGKNFGTAKTVWQDKRYDANVYGSQILKDLVPESEFLFPKSLWNVYDCIRSIVKDDKDAIVLDFFGGSGTTAHAVLELNKDDGGNRKFILFEQMDYVESVTKRRISEVIKRNGSETFTYAELTLSNGIFVDQVLKAEGTGELIDIWKSMQERAFLSYKVEKFDSSLLDEELHQLEVEDFKKLLLEILDMNMLYVPYSERNDETYGIQSDAIVANEEFYGLKDA